MRDPTRIDTILAEIKRVWEKYPDMRLGQILVNAVNIQVGEERGLTDGVLVRRIHLIEDESLASALHGFDQRFSPQENA